MNTVPFFVHSALVEAKRRMCLYLLAFLSIFLVVMTSCVSQSIITAMPIIFKSMAESAEGQIDALVLPAQNNDLFNFT